MTATTDRARRNPFVVAVAVGVLVIVGAGFAACPATAGEPPPGAPPAAAPAPLPGSVELPLLAGKSLTGVVESTDDQEVVLRLSATEVRRIPWAQLAPLGLLRARRALAKPDDGPARLALADLAS